MINEELADAFDTLANLLDLQGENPFKINAYRRVARTLRDLSEDAAVLVREERLREIPGIGERIEQKIRQYVAEGRIDALEKARASVPPGILDLLKVPGLGPRTVGMAYEKLHITDLDELVQAARSGKLAELPRMGAKKVENLLQSIAFMRKAAGVVTLGDAVPLADSVVAALMEAAPGAQVTPAGSLRRMKETVGDIDILATGPDAPLLIRAFTAQPRVERVLAAGETKATAIIAGVQVDLRVVPKESFGAAMQYFTGSKAHNIRLRGIARQRGLKLSEYGLFKGDKPIAGATEEEVYAALGLAWVPPVLREDRGEIEAAQAGKLPKLVQLSDIVGDYHVHTDWSDGHNTIMEMARAAQALGYRKLVISDHTRALKVFGGLDAAEQQKQIAELRACRKKLRGLKLLSGAEVDIHADGSLDLPDEALAKLDFVIASVHSAFKQDEATMTRRIIRAIENPHVDCLGHLTGRLLGRREAYPVDVDAILTAVARLGKAVELNGNPMRLDITDHVCRRAKELGARVVITTDAHHAQDLNFMRFGVATAQRGWLERKDVLNAK